MSTERRIHPNWLRFMYAFTIMTAGLIGLALLVMPETTLFFLGAPVEEPMIAGVVYSVWLAFGILSALGLRSPLKFAPVLLLQLTYKIVWFIAVVVPKAVAGDLPSFAVTLSALFLTYIVGDLIAIPWRNLLAK